MNGTHNLLAIIGPTASGKTTLAARITHKLGGVLISGDSRQVYRGMDIGTGKDLNEYVIDGEKIPYKLIDIVPAGHKYTVFDYQRDFVKAFEECQTAEKFPVLCGGSGLYIEAVLKGYKLLDVPQNPELRKSLSSFSLAELTEKLKTYKKLHNTTETDTCNRAIRAIEIEEYYLTHPEECAAWTFPEIRPLIIGIAVSRDIRRERITARLRARLEAKMIEEVKGLLDSGIPAEDLIYYGLEYKYITLYLTGKLHYDEMVELLNTAIHQFAKRQMTWFRKMEREGFEIHWLDASMPTEEADNMIIGMLRR